MTRVVLDSISVAFDEVKVLSDVSLDITERRVGIVGANGSGKSTLARLINGLVTPTKGTVAVDGLDVVRKGREVRRKVGFIFTDPDGQIVMPTVREDIAFSLRPQRLSGQDVEERVAAIMSNLGIAELADRPAHRLSGGQKQLLALASILVAEPELVIADEPTTLLDARNARMMANVFATLPQSLYVVSHHLEALRDFERIIVVDDGRIVADDEPRPALTYYEQLVES